MTKSNTILITGGAGFIGANLVHTLLPLKLGTIHILTEKNTNRWRLNNVLSSIHVHEVDLADFAAVKKLIQTIKPSTIFHLASFGGLPDQQDSMTIYNVNFYGTVNLLTACKEVGFECFINTGSSSEYGMKEKPMSEDNILEPISDYGVAKAAATQFCLKEALFNKLPVYTIRPFSVYGDYEMVGRLIPTIFLNALLNKPINLSYPYYVRDFIYIKDMVNLYIELARQKPQGPYIYNGGTGIQSTIQDVMTTIEQFFSIPLNVYWGQSTPRPWEPKAWQADTSQAAIVLNWEARYSLQEGLQTTFAWFKQNRGLYEQSRSNISAAIIEQASI